MTVEAADSPLKGMRLEVPAGSYPDNREFKVSETRITGTTFGDDFEPVLPLIDIDNGGGYSEETMLLKVPVGETEDDFFAAYFYDEASGQLEGIPAASSDAEGLTLALGHFAKGTSGASSRIVITLAQRKSLRNRIKRGISVKFTPGKDGWQFKNFGTYPATKGICTGMSLSSMWYYSEKSSKGSLSLYGSLDNDGGDKTSGFDLDDSLGIRLTSAVQLDVGWDQLAERINASINSSDSYNSLAIARDLWKSGKPVFLLLGETPGSRHVVVAYKVMKDRVYISDPNYPGEECSIVFQNNDFQDYEGGGHVYTRIVYIGTWSVVPNKVADRWSELERGSVANDLFPAYTLEAFTAEHAAVPLDGGSTPADQLYVKVKATGTNPSERITVTVYKGTEPALINPEGMFSIDKGANELGFLVEAKTSSEHKWVDFQRMNIQRTEEKKKGKTATELRRVYYSTGELFEEYYSYYDENDQEIYDGVFKTYLKSGYVSQESTYVDGNLEGLSTIYFENSTQPDRTWAYKNGKMNGTMTAYRRDGTIEHTVEYQDDYVVPGTDKSY